MTSHDTRRVTDSLRLRELRDAQVSLEVVMSADRAAGPHSPERLRARGWTQGSPFEL